MEPNSDPLYIIRAYQALQQYYTSLSDLFLFDYQLRIVQQLTRSSQILDSIFLDVEFPPENTTSKFAINWKRYGF